MAKRSPCTHQRACFVNVCAYLQPTTQANTENIISMNNITQREQLNLKQSSRIVSMVKSRRYMLNAIVYVQQAGCQHCTMT